MFMKIFIFCQNFNTLLLYKNAYMVHNSNMKTQMHQKTKQNKTTKTKKKQKNKNKKKKQNKKIKKKTETLTKTFSIPSFGKSNIKLLVPNISCPVVKNLSTKLRIVGFRGARTILKCSLNFC